MLNGWPHIMSIYVFVTNERTSATFYIYIYILVINNNLGSFSPFEIDVPFSHNSDRH